MLRPTTKLLDPGNLTERMALKRRLKCRNFNWLMRVVYPEKYIYDNPAHSFAYGMVSRLLVFKT